MSIFVFIGITVLIGILQTLPALSSVDNSLPVEKAFNIIEWIAAVIFTVEYIMRFIGSPADPAMRGKT
jgi:hypothetical protein